jgi:hypothetical protein
VRQGYKGWSAYRDKFVQDFGGRCVPGTTNEGDMAHCIQLTDLIRARLRPCPRDGVEDVQQYFLWQPLRRGNGLLRKVSEPSPMAASLCTTLRGLNSLTSRCRYERPCIAIPSRPAVDSTTECSLFTRTTNGIQDLLLGLALSSPFAFAMFGVRSKGGWVVGHFRVDRNIGTSHTR